MIQIPLSVVPSQSLSIQLNGQSCQIALRQNGTFLYFSLFLNDVPILTYRLCENRQRFLIASRYRGFKGDFMFVDQSAADEAPMFTGLNTRWILYYLFPNE